MHPVLRSARPKQWLKNILVFAAPGAAGVLDQPGEFGTTLLAFASFSLAASGTYFWNDVLDVESDRSHPTKSKRPIAAGTVSLMTGRVLGTLLPIVALGLAALTGEWRAVVVVAIYMLITLTYSAIWKHIAVIDLVAIASGFVLRAAMGAVAVDVPMSSWFVLVTTFGSLFIVTGKRFAERRDLGADAEGVRSTLGEYSEGYLRFVLAVSCGGALVSYCVWAFEAKTLAGSNLPYYELSVVPMLAAFLRYALVLDQGQGAAPEEVFGRDRVLQILGVIWLIVYGLAVYGVNDFERAWTAVSDVEGWMTEGQAQALYDAAAGCPPGGTVVEIGSFHGRSTIVLASGCPADATVIAIDPHAGNDRGPQEIEGFEAEADQDHATFERNLAAAGVADRVRHLRAFSDDALADIDGAIDVLCVDGAHRYAPARADIARYGDRVRDGGVMLIHDSFSSVGVTLAILRELTFGRRWRYEGRSRSLTTYRAVGNVSRPANAARQLLQLPWFAKNLTLKLLLTLGLGKLLQKLGRRPPDWPY